RRRDDDRDPQRAGAQRNLEQRRRVRAAARPSDRGLLRQRALGPGDYSIDSWAGVANWTGVHWAVSDEVRAGAAVGIGAAAGLLTLAAGWARNAIDAGSHELSAAH